MVILDNQDFFLLQTCCNININCKVGPRGPWWAGPPLPPAGEKVPNGRILPDPGDQWQHTSPVAMTSRRSSPPPRKSLTERSRDQWQHTSPLKPPRPSRIERPISPRRTGNLSKTPSTKPCHPSQGAYINKLLTRQARGLPRPAPFGSGNHPLGALCH